LQGSKQNQRGLVVSGLQYFAGFFELFLFALLRLLFANRSPKPGNLFVCGKRIFQFGQCRQTDVMSPGREMFASVRDPLLPALFLLVLLRNLQQVPDVLIVLKLFFGGRKQRDTAVVLAGGQQTSRAK